LKPSKTMNLAYLALLFHLFLGSQCLNCHIAELENHFN
jgi:hypothetical protein